MKRPASFLTIHHLFILIFLLGLILKLFELDLRPFHHDESIHGLLSLYYYMDAKLMFYKYDPMTHGPVLYHLLPFSYYIFGISNWSARFIITAIASLLPLASLNLFNKVPKGHLLFLGTYLTLSPLINYWSRFLRHDFLVIIPLLLCFGVVIYFKNKYLRSCILGILIAIQFCAKENSFIHLGLFIIFTSSYFLFTPKKNRLKIAFCPRQILLGLLSFTLVFCYFYSAGFQYWTGILDGLYQKSLVYWTKQHNIGRIKGPFSYQFFIMLFYEPWIILALFATYIRQWREIIIDHKRWGYFLIFLFLLDALISFSPINHFIKFSSLWDLFKLTMDFDIFLFFALLIMGVSSTIYHFKRAEPLKAFLSYITFSFFFTYSFVGEKVPWLQLYIQIAASFYIVILWKDWTIQKPIFRYLALFSFISLLMIRNLQINYTNPGSGNHLISQVHTSREYEQIALKIQNDLQNEKQSPAPYLLSIKDNLWPLSWYVYGLNGYHFGMPKMPIQNYRYILTSTRDLKTLNETRSTHRSEIVTMRHWFVPNYGTLTIKSFLKYLIYFRPWGPIGEQKVRFIEQKTK